MKLLAFLATGLLITFPWFARPGYLFLLDWSGAPHVPLSLNPTGGIAGVLPNILWHELSFASSSDFAQKALILLILVLAGITTAMLVQQLLAKLVQPNTNQGIAIMCGIFAMTNPFVFNRIEMGHINLLFAYALVPLAVLLTLRFFTTPSIGSALRASIAACGTILMSIHHIVLLPLILVFFVWHHQRARKISLQHYAFFIGPFLVTILIIVLILFNAPESSIKHLGIADTALFAPQPQCTSNIIADTALLVAQWRNPRAVPLPCAHATLFHATWSALIIVMLIGAWHNKKLALGAVAFIALTVTPFASAMRDSAKYIADLALIESVLLAYGCAYIYIRTKNKIILIAGLFVVLLAGSPMFWGLSNTIIPRNYPASWHAWEEQLAQLPEKPVVLFLPWHLYLPFDFTNQTVIANPAQQFFTHASVIQGDNLEMRQNNNFIATQSASQASQDIARALALRSIPDFPPTFRTLLTTQHITYIALSHGSPEELQYRNLFASLPFLRQISDAPGLTVWQVEE